MTTAHLNCGYSGTGKDSLFQIVKSGAKIIEVSRPEPSDRTPTPECVAFKGSWLIYARSETPKLSYGPEIIRFAFADKLKVAVHQELELKLTLEEAEKVKNTLEVKHPKTGEQKTLRSWYIEIASRCRAQDPDYFAKLALDSYREGKEDLFGTDLRYPNELAYARKHFAKVTTNRVFRSEVKAAPAAVISEHQLDDLETDYLMVTSEGEFEQALQVFPQYKNFVLKWMFF